jgi:hypothetical protein
MFVALYITFQATCHTEFRATFCIGGNSNTPYIITSYLQHVIDNPRLSRVTGGRSQLHTPCLVSFSKPIGWESHRTLPSDLLIQWDLRREDARSMQLKSSQGPSGEVWSEVRAGPLRDLHWACITTPAWVYRPWVSKTLYGLTASIPPNLSSYIFSCSVYDQ